MGRKAKYTFEQKLIACEEYLNGRKSAKEIAQELSMGKHDDGKIRLWSKIYQAHGPDILKETPNYHGGDIRLFSCDTGAV